MNSLSRCSPSSGLFSALLAMATAAVSLAVPAVQGQSSDKNLVTPRANGDNVLSSTVGAEVIPAISLEFSTEEIQQTASYSLDLGYNRRLHSFTRTELWLDVPAVVGPSHRTSGSTGELPTSLATFYVPPSVRVSVPLRSGVSPWLSAGGGYGLFETSDSFANGTSNPIIHTNTGVLQFGGGVDFSLPIRVIVPLGIRTEFRDFYSLTTAIIPVASASSSQHGLTAGVGLTATF